MRSKSTVTRCTASGSSALAMYDSGLMPAYHTAGWTVTVELPDTACALASVTVALIVNCCVPSSSSSAAGTLT